MFKLFLLYLVNKFVNIKLYEQIEKYCISQVTIEKSWDGVETIQVTLKTLSSWKKENKIDVDKDLYIYPWNEVFMEYLERTKYAKIL